MSKYFGKCFGPSTPAPESSFWLRCPSFLLSKFSSQLKLIQSVVRVRILGICFTSSNLRVLLSGFWDFALRILAICNSQIPISRVLGVRVSCPRVPVRGSWVAGSRVPGSIPESQGHNSQSPGSQGPGVPGLRVPGPGSEVLILDYAILIAENSEHCCL